ncbi:hypothetical protein ACP70R_025050 [Stipagrostis hirtigluma subsp. patula]
MDRGSSEPLVHFCFQGHDYGMVTPAYADAVVRRHEQERRSSAPSSASSSSRGTRRGVETISRPVAALCGSSCAALHLRRRPGYATDGAGTRVWQSAMYSDRPRRHRVNRGQAQPPTDLSAAVDGGDMGSGLPDPTIMVPSAAEEALSPSVFAGDQDMPQTELERVCGRALCIQIVQGDSGVIEDKHSHQPTYLAAVHGGDMGSGLPDPTIVVPSAAEEALSPRSEYQRLIEGQPTFDTMDDVFEYLCNSCISAHALAKGVSQQSLLDEFEAQSVLQEEEARSVPAPEQARPIPAPEQAQPIQGYCEASDEEIAQNGKKWMSEEVMVAFRKYVEKHDDLKELEYEFDELHHQCFSVENYHKIFHHFNFTVKMKAPGSTDWTSMLCFAEVKEILTQKIYFCSPLEPHENGHCGACKNQGMDELKHPVIGAFDRGSADAEFPFNPEECNYLMYEVDPFD